MVLIRPSARVAQSMVSVALVLFTLERFGSSTFAGFVTFASIFPGLLTSPIAGVLLDRHGRIRLVRLDYFVALAAMMVIGVLASVDALPGGLLIAIAVVIGVQVALGAWLALVDRWASALPAHGVLALALSALLLWTGSRLHGRAGALLAVLAVAAPLAGFTSLQYDSSASAALAHACAAALLIAAAAYALSREA